MSGSILVYARCVYGCVCMQGVRLVGHGQGRCCVQQVGVYDWLLVVNRCDSLARAEQTLYANHEMVELSCNSIQQLRVTVSNN